VLVFSNSIGFLRRAAVASASVAILCAALFAAAAAHPDEPGTDSVGVIDGAAIAVTGPMRVEAVHGQVKTILRSGSDVRVKSGTARIDLVEGGQITICGPAHFSVLKSGGSLTVALDSGTIHAHVEHEPVLTIYTPQIQVQTVAIGDGPQDALVGFDNPGAMCIRANRGAVRLEQQLTGQSILVPQAGDVLLLNGQLDSLRTSAGRCSCEAQVAKASPPPEPEISRLASTEEVQRKSLEAKRGPSPAPVAVLTSYLAAYRSTKTPSFRGRNGSHPFCDSGSITLPFLIFLQGSTSEIRLRRRDRTRAEIRCSTSNSPIAN